MHDVLTHGTKQSIKDRGIANVEELLKFVTSEWGRYENSKRLTMRDLTIPSHITHFVINGVLYEMSERRTLWFEKCGKRYFPHRFYVSEVTDLSGHPFQLHLERSNGVCYEDLRLILARPLGGVRLGRVLMTTPAGMH